ncbi:SH3 domain-containing protein [Methylibium sp.]|uniref:SH3 domain-containing protein n=1 Tax=Methylibium sp. TaxID=2067992 RepID=UPI003D13B886
MNRQNPPLCGWRSAFARTGLALFLVAAAAAHSPAVRAADANADTDADADVERVQVADPYIELHTGPGRGYPVHFVAAREEWIAITLRHTDWYKVRTAGGKVGWVHRRQLETTLTEAGGKKTFRDIAIDDYLGRRVQLGAAWGRFKSEPMLKFWASYKLSETLSVEGTLGQVQGLYSGTDFWHVNVLAEPWSDQRLSPFFGIGLGKFKNFPNQSLVGASVTDAKLGNAGIGALYHVSERLVLRVDYTIYTAFIADTRTGEYRAVTAGLSFFF